MDREELRKRVEANWKALNEYGIYTEEQLDEAIAKLPKLDISPMTVPLDKLGDVDLEIKER